MPTSISTDATADAVADDQSDNIPFEPTYEQRGWLREKRSIKETTAYQTLQREVIGLALNDKQRSQKVVQAVDCFDPIHGRIVEAMAAALKRDELLKRDGLLAYLDNRQKNLDSPNDTTRIYSADDCCRSRVAWVDCNLVAAGTPSDLQQQVADTFGTSPSRPGASQLAFDEKLAALRRHKPADDPKPAEIPVTTLDLRDFPQPIQDFVNAMARKCPLIPPVILLGAAYATYGTLIGKGMRYENDGIFYPSPCVVGMVETGGCKTGAMRTIERQFQDFAIDRLVPSATMSGLFDAIGLVIPKKDWEKLSETERTTKIRDLVFAAREDKRGRILLSDECTGALELLLGGWDSKRPSQDLQEFLKLTDSGSLITRQTKGDGYRAIADCCFSFLGFTQNETWQEKFGGDSFKNVGLFGRFIPFSTKFVTLTGVTGKPSQPLHTLLNIPAPVHTVECYFGNPVPYGEPDAIGRIKMELAESETGRRFRAVYPREWGQLQNKIVCHAIRLSMIDAYLEGRDRDGLSPASRVDCLPYFKRHAAMVMSLYMAYLDQVETLSYYGQMREKVIGLLRRFGTMSKRELKQRANFYGNQFVEIMADLLREGIVTANEVPNKHGPKSVVYTLVTAAIP